MFFMKTWEQTFIGSARDSKEVILDNSKENPKTTLVVSAAIFSGALACYTSGIVPDSDAGIAAVAIAAGLGMGASTRELSRRFWAA